MNEYETEEQQIEALKKWWKENGSSLIIGLALGISALFGWRYYAEHKNQHALQASEIYMQVMRNVALKTVDDKTIDMNNKLINDYADTPYAALSSLLLARSEYEKGNTDIALAQLELAQKHASDEVLKQVSSLRLARLYIEQKKFDQAARVLEQAHESAYDALYEELKGDLYQAQGQTEQAKQAYDRAINLHGLAAGKWLKLKRQNTGLLPEPVSGQKTKPQGEAEAS